MDKFQEHLAHYQAHVKEDLEKRVAFIREQIDGPGLGGAVVGISGGIDSAVSAALCVRALGRERVIGVWMPAYSQAIHAEDAQKLADAIGLQLVTVDLGPAFDAIVPEIEKVLPLDDKTKGNTKARLRMTTLYAIANQKGYLVVDTCNRSEIYIGYMTKGGDGLADINPVASLTKHEIRILARELGVPESILTKAPSADLWEGQTDEKEMGFSYEDLDRLLITGETDPEAKKRIDYLHRISEHKRRPMPEV
ncbi:MULTISPECIES: NAD(+) synthase [Bacillales]|mgnify:CR=1 FL=1|jgi:NAD+ synthase|uniref:NH(3)-dependent NAD(+) synthetase n=1 Tax=Brevibacillus aydinogluensis TaxID=927786 RepID=A0AA48M5S7_9BACL|nr:MULTISPECIES: NAD(+) synthase [Bacillales]REK61659.1 MAG: NAD(+) synthase [Brevibacillus sp.]MBR8660257.1 NAD(+) synthase [Brevibacillus sp. NL20B1]MDT3416702.1 NAD+ synthase [Brevibacillus aydinogluensis]NNV04094.1 NAD(+) synthase [Brevibacillus sp. MCWH]UFJ61355.1 NAD(+) synthase [Anoxybacillus sediminis]